MNNPYGQAGKYKSIDIQTRIEAASPHELINLLLQGAKTHVLGAQNSIARNQIKDKCEHVSKAIAIIDGLKASLDHDKSPELANNLFNLYSQIQDFLLKANINNDENLFIQSNKLLDEIHAAWQNIKPAQ